MRSKSPMNAKSICRMINQYSKTHVLKPGKTRDLLDGTTKEKIFVLFYKQNPIKYIWVGTFYMDYEYGNDTRRFDQNDHVCLSILDIDVISNIHKMLEHQFLDEKMSEDMDSFNNK